jgi:uncharacterized membrane protein (DUF373 family)
MRFCTIAWHTARLDQNLLTHIRPKKGSSVFLLDVFRKQARGRTLYEWFEQIVLGIIVLIMSVVIVYSLILGTITLFGDLVSGIESMETSALKDTFGLILTVIILVEFNHSIVLAIRQRSGAIQVRIVVLITIIVLARKLVLLDYTTAWRPCWVWAVCNLLGRSILADFRWGAAQDPARLDRSMIESGQKR